MSGKSEAIRPGGRLVLAIGRRVGLRELRAALILLAVGLGALHAWAGAMRQSMNADGIAYLDMGDAFWRGDWPMAINAVWSPLYAVILGLALRLSNPTPLWEFRVVHLVNFLIYVGALACFDFFWRQLVRAQQCRADGLAGGGSATLPAWAWWSLGYGLFIWSSLSMIEIWSVTPDMGVAAFVYLAAGLILRIWMGSLRWRAFALLGAVLGLAYLAKAIMFPLAFVFLAASLVAAGSLRKGMPLALVALVVFLAVGGPFIAALSQAKGRLTFGETGKLTYAWFVDGVPYPHWQGETPGAGAPIHPTRKILTDPPIYEFTAPVGGTYPVAYDPSYWYEGLTPYIDLRGQLRALLSNVQYYFDLFVRQQGGLLAGLAILCMMGSRALRAARLRPAWSLALPALAAFGMYALVYAENRYLAAFVMLLWAAALCTIRLPDSQLSRRLLGWTSGVMLLFVALGIAAFNVEGLNALLLRRLVGEPVVRHDFSLGAPQDMAHGSPADIAAGLRQLGIQPGDQVAFLGYSFDAAWARLARVRIVAEMYPYDPARFWSADGATQTRILQVFAGARARAVVANQAPRAQAASGWRRVSDTGYYVYLFTK
jgi:hypothetical protein